MKKISFNLACPSLESLMPGPEPVEYRVPVASSRVLLKKRAEVAAYAPVASAPDASIEDVHSPVDGVITDITPEYIVVTPQPVNLAPVAPIRLDALTGDELLTALRRLGVSPRDLNSHADILVINALNPEPGVFFSRTLLEEHTATLEAGLKLVRALGRFQQITLVLPEGSKAKLGGLHRTYIKPIYPNSRPPLVMLAATGREMPANVTVASLHLLWRLGRVAETGLPLAEGIVAIQGKNYRFRAGSTIRDLLRAVQISVEEGDFVVLGGVMRGEAVSDLDLPLPLYVYALSHIPYRKFWPVGEHPCINCGLCVRHCPSRLMPNLISRYAEISRFEATRDLHVNACMDCGLCSYYCISRRPMLHYMRLSKSYLAAKDRAARQNEHSGG